MSMNAFDAAIAGESVLVTETGMEPLQLLGRVGSSTFVIAGSRKELCPSSLNPYELLGAALGACTAMTLRLCAEQMAIPLQRVQVSVSHHPGTRGASALFERAIILEGPLDQDQRRRLLEAAERSPVDKTLSNGADIHTYLCNGDQISAAPATSDYLKDIEASVADLKRGGVLA